jgi:hypothetical protein
LNQKPQISHYLQLSEKITLLGAKVLAVIAFGKLELDA